MPIKAPSKLSSPGNSRPTCSETMRRKFINAMCLPQELLYCLAREPIHSAASPIFLPAFVCVYERLYPRVYVRRTSLGITHVTLLSTCLHPRAWFLNYSQTTVAFCSNTPGVLALSGLYPVYTLVSRKVHNEASYYCCSAALRLSRDERIPIEKSTTGNEKGDLFPLALTLLLLLDCFRRCRYFAKYTQRASKHSRDALSANVGNV